MQQQLDTLIKQQNLSRAVARGNLALVVVDLTDADNPAVASVNGDKMIYAASLPKIAILLGAFVQMERGKLVADPALWLDMTRMIRHSGNQAATRVLERVGREELLQILQSLVNLLGIPSSLNFAVMGSVILAGVIADTQFSRYREVRRQQIAMSALEDSAKR